MKYEYVTTQTDISQYDYLDELSYGETVKAKYVKSKIAIDVGNPYIEALPKLLSRPSIQEQYTKRIYWSSLEERKDMSNEDKILEILQLRDIRFPLPFHYRLEEYFMMALVASYRNRHIVFKNDLYAIKNDKKMELSLKIMAKTGSATNGGISLLGLAGCGKSSAINIMLSRYPQIIEHTSNKFMRFVQIVYIVVTCPTNSNFSALYEQIGISIDQLFGNSEPVYSNLIRKRRTIGEKTNFICELINKFGIGAIVFDEIQLLDFTGQKEATFESLLTIANITKVAMLFVGTEEAHNKMFLKMRNARRAGIIITADQYCDDIKYFSSIATNLLQYQYFDEPLEATPEILQKLYEVSGGIINELINIYIQMQIDYLYKNNKPKIDENYIQRIADKHFPNMQKLLKNASNLSVYKQIQDAIKDNNRINIILDDNYDHDSKIMTENLSIDNGNKIIRQNSITNVKNMCENNGLTYDQNKIEKAVDRIFKMKKSSKMSEEQISSEAYDYLKNEKTYKKRKTKAINHDNLLSQLQEYQITKNNI